MEGATCAVGRGVPDPRVVRRIPSSARGAARPKATSVMRSLGSEASRVRRSPSSIFPEGPSASARSVYVIVPAVSTLTGKSTRVAAPGGIVPFHSPAPMSFAPSIVQKAVVGSGSPVRFCTTARRPHHPPGRTRMAGSIMRACSPGRARRHANDSPAAATWRRAVPDRSSGRNVTRACRTDRDGGIPVGRGGRACAAALTPAALLLGALSSFLPAEGEPEKLRCLRPAFGPAMGKAAQGIGRALGRARTRLVHDRGATSPALPCRPVRRTDLDRQRFAGRRPYRPARPRPRRATPPGRSRSTPERCQVSPARLLRSFIGTRSGTRGPRRCESVGRPGAARRTRGVPRAASVSREIPLIRGSRAPRRPQRSGTIRGPCRRIRLPAIDLEIDPAHCCEEASDLVSRKRLRIQVVPSALEPPRRWYPAFRDGPTTWASRDSASIVFKTGRGPCSYSNVPPTAQADRLPLAHDQARPWRCSGLQPAVSTTVQAHIPTPASRRRPERLYTGLADRATGTRSRAGRLITQVARAGSNVYVASPSPAAGQGHLEEESPVGSVTSPGPTCSGAPGLVRPRPRGWSGRRTQPAFEPVQGSLYKYQRRPSRPWRPRRRAAGEAGGDPLRTGEGDASPGPRTCGRGRLPVPWCGRWTGTRPGRAPQDDPVGPRQCREEDLSVNPGSAEAGTTPRTVGADQTPPAPGEMPGAGRGVGTADEAFQRRCRRGDRSGGP
jgi:hypothetical protein